MKSVRHGYPGLVEYPPNLVPKVNPLPTRDLLAPYAQERPPCPGVPEDHYRWVSNRTSISGLFLVGPDSTGHWEKKTEEEIDMIEAMKEVDAIAPGWKDED